MPPPHSPDYVALLVCTAAMGPVVRDVLVPVWIRRDATATPWPRKVLEVEQGRLTFLFDATPKLNGVPDRAASDRVVAVWGRSANV